MRPSKKDFIKAIYAHNKQKIYKKDGINEYVRYIDYSSFGITSLEPELVFLHVKLIFLEENQFIITNGWSNDYSSELIELFDSKFSSVIAALGRN